MTSFLSYSMIEDLTTSCTRVNEVPVVVDLTKGPFQPMLIDFVVLLLQHALGVLHH